MISYNVDGSIKPYLPIYCKTTEILCERLDELILIYYKYTVNKYPFTLYIGKLFDMSDVSCYQDIQKLKNYKCFDSIYINKYNITIKNDKHILKEIIKHTTIMKNIFHIIRSTNNTSYKENIEFIKNNNININPVFMIDYKMKEKINKYEIKKFIRDIEI